MHFNWRLQQPQLSVMRVRAPDQGCAGRVRGQRVTYLTGVEDGVFSSAAFSSLTLLSDVVSVVVLGAAAAAVAAAAAAAAEGTVGAVVLEVELLDDAAVVED